MHCLRHPHHRHHQQHHHLQHPWRRPTHTQYQQRDQPAHHLQHPPSTVPSPIPSPAAPSPSTSPASPANITSDATAHCTAYGNHQNCPPPPAPAPSPTTPSPSAQRIACSTHISHTSPLRRLQHPLPIGISSISKTHCIAHNAPTLPTTPLTHTYPTTPPIPTTQTSHAHTGRPTTRSGVPTAQTAHTMNTPTRTPTSGQATQALPRSRDHPHKHHATTAASHLPLAPPGPAPRRPEATRCLRADTHTGEKSKSELLDSVVRYDLL